MKNDDISFRDQIKNDALRTYKKELLDTTRGGELGQAKDLGSKNETRKNLRIICKDAVIEASNAMKRKYSYSAISSIMSAHEEKTAQSALRALQQERLIVSRLGFPEKAFELDRQIDLIRGKVKAERDKEEAQLVEQRMKMLAGSHARKRMNLERQLHDEKTKLEKQYEEWAPAET